MNERKQSADDPATAPESGTVRDETSGNQPSDRGRNDPASGADTRRPTDDPSTASEEP
jgi:hypothetical protein